MSPVAHGPIEKITTTIKREWLREIVSGRKRIEYREIKPYWTEQLEGRSVPFLLRLINGMDAHAPEVTVLVERVRRNPRERHFELHLGRIVDVRNWDRKRERPSFGR
jgi:hypothetical protein